MIADKTHSEILAMTKEARYRWRKTLLLEEREEAMRIVESVRRAKMSGDNSASKRPEVRAKISEAMKDKSKSEEHKASLRASWTSERKAKFSGENHPMKRPEVIAKFRGKKRPQHSERMRGKNHPNFKDWASRAPYCHRWNELLRESIRNRDNRTCVLCGRGEIQNGQRLSVHHISGNKMMGCNGIPWYLCALCRSCNTRRDTVEKEFLIVTGGRSVQ